MLRVFGYLFSVGAVLLIAGVAVSGFFFWFYSQEVPDFDSLSKYEPAVMTRIHAGDGSLLAEYAREHRLYVPIQAIPKHLINAFLAAEDKNFYSHKGLDYKGILRAILVNLKALGTDRRFQGASTITQQMAKNFLLSSERRLRRKVKEAILALRIEKVYSKEQILELYLNEIYLGFGSYGVAASALNYFGKSLSELSIAEVAYLAALPKAPNNYHPIYKREKAVFRRNWVIDRMVENGFITEEQGAQARQEPFEVTPRKFGPRVIEAAHFVEEVRRELFQIYGENQLYEGGLSVRTTLDTKLQMIAQRVLRAGLIRFDRKAGWRGPVTRIETSGDWGPMLTDIPFPEDLKPWHLAVVLEVKDGEARIGLRPGRNAKGEVLEIRDTGIIPLKDVLWARRAMGRQTNERELGNPILGPKVLVMGDVLKPRDVIYVEAVMTEDQFSHWQLRQLPEVEGALLALDPHTGRIKAMVGGFSFSFSQFNRAIQAWRQPGSAFKPFVYAAALDNGYTPSSVVMDAPFAIRQLSGEVWRPKNYGNTFYGPSTLRRGIEKSRNVMTVRLAEDIGMDLVAEYARRFGINDDMMPVLSMALGAGEVTLLRMVTGYAMLANGGKKIMPTLIDRVQDRYGRTIWRHDTRQCRACRQLEWNGQDEPNLIDQREQVVDPYTAYQVVAMLEGVVQRGTGSAVRNVGRPLAGKTGTSNEEKDSWFVGFSPDLAVGVYIGYDEPRSMGKKGTGGHLAAPVFRDFMIEALNNKPVVPFRVPAGMSFIRINLNSGLQARPGDSDVILEAFKPGTRPPSETTIIGAALSDFFEVQLLPDKNQQANQDPDAPGVMPLGEEVLPFNTGIGLITKKNGVIVDYNSTGGLY